MGRPARALRRGQQALGQRADQGLRSGGCQRGLGATVAVVAVSDARSRSATATGTCTRHTAAASGRASLQCDVVVQLGAVARQQGLLLLRRRAVETPTHTNNKHATRSENRLFFQGLLSEVMNAVA